MNDDEILKSLRDAGLRPVVWKDLIVTFPDKSHFVKCPECGRYTEKMRVPTNRDWLDSLSTAELVEAGNAAQAAYKTFGYEVHDVDEMGEETAVFWDHLPIDEGPRYVGTTISCDFPDDVVCGMYLPCPGTNGRELEEKHG